MATEVLDLFLELARASPSGEERGAGDAVLAYLRDCGLEAEEDDVEGVADRLDHGKRLRTRRADGGRGEPIFLRAHLDEQP